MDVPYVTTNEALEMVHNMEKHEEDNRYRSEQQWIRGQQIDQSTERSQELSEDKSGRRWFGKFRGSK